MIPGIIGEWPVERHLPYVFEIRAVDPKAAISNVCFEVVVDTSLSFSPLETNMFDQWKQSSGVDRELVVSEDNARIGNFLGLPFSNDKDEHWFVNTVCESISFAIQNPGLFRSP